MKIFNRDNRSGGSRDAKGSGRRDLGRRNFGGGGGRGFGGRDSGRPSMHQVTCSECGKECEVPFKPTEGKPVFCRDCFQKHRKF